MNLFVQIVLAIEGGVECEKGAREGGAEVEGGVPAREVLHYAFRHGLKEGEERSWRECLGENAAVSCAFELAFGVLLVDTDTE